MTYALALGIAAVAMLGFGGLNVYHATAGNAETAPLNLVAGIAFSGFGIVLSAAAYVAARQAR